MNLYTLGWFAAARRALARHQHRTPEAIPMWRLLAGEVAVAWHALRRRVTGN